MKVYLMSTVKFNLVKFHSGTSTKTPCSETTHLANGHTVVGWHLPERYTRTQTKCALTMH